MVIKILTTGGTIDGLEYSSADQAPKKHKSLIPGLLKQSRITIEYDIEEMLAKDSKFIDDKNRELIAEKCRDCSENKIVITHGTVAMTETAKYLGKKKISKTIVLLGSHIPANKENSDAMFNLGAAITATQLLDNGVYVVMNGKIFSWDNVKKNIEKGVFEEEK